MDQGDRRPLRIQHLLILVGYCAATFAIVGQARRLDEMVQRLYLSAVAVAWPLVTLVLIRALAAPGPFRGWATPVLLILPEALVLALIEFKGPFVPGSAYQWLFAFFLGPWFCIEAVRQCPLRFTGIDRRFEGTSGGFRRWALDLPPKRVNLVTALFVAALVIAMIARGWLRFVLFVVGLVFLMGRVGFVIARVILEVVLLGPLPGSDVARTESEGRSPPPVRPPDDPA